MVTNVKRMGIEYQCRTRNTPTYRHKCKLQLFLAAGSFNFVPMDICGPFSKTTQDRQSTLASTAGTRILRAQNLPQRRRLRTTRVYFPISGSCPYGIHSTCQRITACNSQVDSTSQYWPHSALCISPRRPIACRKRSSQALQKKILSLLRRYVVGHQKD